LVDVAEVIGARVGVVASQCLTATPSALTGISLGTRIPIVAIVGIGEELATRIRVTGVIRTVVAVATGKKTGGNTLPELAVVTYGTKILVITGGRVQGGHAATIGITDIVGARVVILAFKGASRLASAPLAMVTCRTKVAVVANCRIGRMHASIFAFTAIVGTGIPIIATPPYPGLATLHRITSFGAVTRIAIIANQHLTGHATRL